MSVSSTSQTLAAPQLDSLDRAAVLYLVLPVVVFVLGWFRLWVSVPLAAVLVACTGWRLLAPRASNSNFPLQRVQVVLAVLLGCAWVYFSGIAHFVYANADWYTRDAVLHDLVAAPWPVIYQMPDGLQVLLRAPLGFYMPAALVGKALGLPSAHLFLAAWTAVGVVLFLLQAMSLAPARLRSAICVGVIVIFFSGLDFVGSALNWGPRFFTTYDITSHIEWWAGSYQYSAMTTQLFWVPNHALGAWVLTGLLARSPKTGDLDRVLPVLVVCAAVWSPLSALGILPFVAVRLGRDWRRRLACYLRPDASIPALLLVAAIGLYYTLDTGGISKGIALGKDADGDFISPLLTQWQFFLFEAGLLGLAVLAIRRSADVIMALVVLLLLPSAQLGPGNDLVMRTSIPSLTILLLGCCAALYEADPERRLLRRKLVLTALLGLGAITAVHEFARSVLIRAWPANMHSSLIAVSCGMPPHYVARMLDQPILRLMRPSQVLPVEFEGRQVCMNPAWELRALREQSRAR